MNTFKWRQAISEADGSASFGRIASTILLICVMSWLSWYIWNKQTLPAGAEVVLYITGALLPYTVAKTGSTIQNAVAGKTEPS
jgi:hypothetical protein